MRDPESSLSRHIGVQDDKSDIYHAYFLSRYRKFVYPMGEDKLKEMVVAHKVVKVDGNNSLPDGIAFENLPVLSDGHEGWTSEDEIKTYLEKLHQDILLSQSLQSDTCHLDPKNPEECL